MVYRESVDFIEDILSSCKCRLMYMWDFFGIVQVQLEILVQEYVGCGIIGDLFVFDKELSDILRLWMRAGPAYKELGFSAFVCGIVQESKL